MPSVERSATINASRQVVWDFVRDMDNWAPYLRGYISHEQHNANESTWLLKGNLGGLSRTAEFKVTVLEWAGPDRVRFVLEGINEPMSGSGSFQSFDVTDGAGAEGGATAAPAPAEPAPAKGLRRVWEAFWRFILHAILKGSAPEARTPHEAVAGEQQTRVQFQLELSVAGTSGKIIDILIAPLLVPVAEELIGKIANALDAQGEGATI